MVRRPLLVCAALLTSLGWTGSAAAGGFTQTETKVTMSDGARIAVSFFEPTGTPPAGGWPAVMLFHGLGKTRNDADFDLPTMNQEAATSLAPNGYAVLTFDARAHGESEGLFSLDGPRELADTRELFDWLTSHPEIDGKHVGAFGVSYGGGMTWLAAAAGVPFAAIVPAATWTDLRQALAPDGLVRAGIVLGFAQDIPAERYAPGLRSLLSDAFAGRNVPALRDLLAVRSAAPRLGRLRIPTLMLQGRRDFAFDADQALVAFRRLRGPKRLYLGDLGHTPAANPLAEFPHYEGEARAWFDRFLKGVPNGIDKRPPIEIAADPWTGRTISFGTVPPTRRLRFDFAAHGVLTGPGRLVRTTRRIGRVETFGSPTARVTLSSRAGYQHLVVVLSAIRPNGTELLIADGGAATADLGPKPRTVTIRLADELTPIPAGSRLRLTIGARSTVQNLANLVYLNTVPDTSRATIGRVVLSVSALRHPVSP